jgi:hypothetical protein
MSLLPLRRLVATRYVTALREGGSVPALVEAQELDPPAARRGAEPALFVAKFQAAAQGGLTLAAELIAGEIARAAELPIPELAFIEIDAALGRSEPHQEIQELLVRSAGTNLAMGYLAGALGYDVAARRPVDGQLAARIVALDLYVSNVDRTARNPNLLWQGDDLWLIDNGASLIWAHGWDGRSTEAELIASAERPFARAKDHVLLPLADGLPQAAAWLAAALDDSHLAAIVATVPDGWLAEAGPSLRPAYLTWLRARRAALPRILDEAERVRPPRV